MRRLSIIPALEKDSRLVAWAQTGSGRIAILLLFFFGLSVQVHGRLLLSTTVVLGLLSFLPDQRRPILLFSALFWAVLHSPVRWETLRHLMGARELKAAIPDQRAWATTCVAVVLVACALVFRLLRARQASWAARYPALALAAFHGLLLVALEASPFRGPVWLAAWSFALVSAHYLWYLAYALLDLRRTPDRSFTTHLGVFQPFWGSTQTPFPKGAAYLDQIEARTPEALAVSQLKGLKLLWWSLFLYFLERLGGAVFYGHPSPVGARLPVALPVAELALAFRASVAGHPLPWHQNWLAMFVDLGMDGLHLAVWGHRFVAIARMAGFAARRNTYKPFLATNVSEFFNRYYYYFKELLVDLFFYPVLYALPRRRLKLALFLATVAAAGGANYLYHFYRDAFIVAQVGLWRALVVSHLHAAYCALLALAIFVSQVRRIGRARQPLGRLAELRAVLTVWLIYAVLNSLTVDLRQSTLLQHLRFLVDALPSIPA